ncbi:hypothetical protein OFN63_42000, partial [Escherichia coli]|nr:hypothetical protein [Escherichia coli]
VLLPGAAEQDVAVILHAVAECVAALPGSAVATVRHIALSGQMHGVVLWASDHRVPPSVLVTWEDRRVSDARVAAAN